MTAFNDDICFIHIPKTAGKSVRTYMAQHLPDIITPEHPSWRFPVGHLRVRDIQRVMGRSPESFTLIFAVIRHPCAQQVSQAVYWADRCFWGGTHIHDVRTWDHVSEAATRLDIARHAFGDGHFTWGPRHINLASWVADPECDFHVWYERTVGTNEEKQQRKPNVRKRAGHDGHSMYEEHGGLYRYWLEASDGQIPENVQVVLLEEIGDGLPALLQPFADHPLPTEIPRENTTRHAPWQAFFSSHPSALRAE
jgi:hypothetical protein